MFVVIVAMVLSVMQLGKIAAQEVGGMFDEPMDISFPFSDSSGDTPTDITESTDTYTTTNSPPSKDPNPTNKQEDDGLDTVEYDPNLFFDISEKLLTSVSTLGGEDEQIPTNQTTIQQKLVAAQEIIRAGPYGGNSDVSNDVVNSDLVLSGLSEDLKKMLS